MINKLKKKQQKRLFILYKNLYKHIKILNKSKSNLCYRHSSHLAISPSISLTCVSFSSNPTRVIHYQAMARWLGGQWYPQPQGF